MGDDGLVDLATVGHRPVVHGHHRRTLGEFQRDPLAEVVADGMLDLATETGAELEGALVVGGRAVGIDHRRLDEGHHHAGTGFDVVGQCVLYGQRRGSEAGLTGGGRNDLAQTPSPFP
jgi:hypothetical protein